MHGIKRHVFVTLRRDAAGGFWREAEQGFDRAAGALAGAEFQAAVSYYGIPPQGAYDLQGIVNPLMGHFALRDEYFTIDQVDALDAALTAAGKPHEFHRYDADHAFCNENRPEVFNAACRDLADQRTLEFFARYLK